MEKPIYPIRVSESRLWYEFESISEQKIVTKAIAFYADYQNSESFELIFGDLRSDGTIDVKTQSKNRDMTQILGTVMQTVYYFFELYPSKNVTFMGSTDSRNRLYRVLISKFLLEQDDHFQVFGLTFDNEFELFESNKDYFSYKIILKP